MTVSDEEHRANLARWRDVDTLADMAALTIAWLNGEVSSLPDHLGPPAAETTPLIPDLITINRADAVTTQSQPGIPRDDTGYAQRAFLEVICEDDTAEKLTAGLRYSELVVVSFPPGFEGGGRIVVTVDAGEREFTWLGNAGSFEDRVEPYAWTGNRQVMELAALSWRLQIFDPVWGKNTMWSSVIEALGGDPQADG